jgi:serine/threonine-protein kinase
MGAPDSPDDVPDAERSPFEPTVRRKVPTELGATPPGNPFDDATRVRPISSESDPLIGATLGEYRVLAPLGSGGMGLVYRGEQPVIGRAVAIKVLKREYADDPSHARRFLEEARSVSAARHPGIVDIFSFGNLPSGEPYLVMELLEGSSLDVVLAEHGRMSVNDAITLLLPVLSALSAAHAAGVIHRDLKPANIFVVQLRDGTTFPKLLDFGLARRGAAGQRLRQTSVGGTPLYIAPEQARGDAIGPQTDLYSLGCVIYEMLVGRPPFNEGNLHALLDQHASLAPVPVRSLRSELPKSMERLVQELLAKDPADRPESALAVRQRLEEIQRELAGAPRPSKSKSKRELQEVVTEPNRPAVARAEVKTDPEHVAPTVAMPVLTEPSARPRWLLPVVGVAAVVLLIGVAAKAFSPPAVEPPPPRPPLVTPIPESPQVPEPQEPKVTPVEVVKPEVVKPEKPEKPENPPPVVETPRPQPGKVGRQKHTRDEVQKKWKKLEARTQTLSEDLRRAARRQLQEAKLCADPPDVCWRDLKDIERTYFGGGP